MSSDEEGPALGSPPVSGHAHASMSIPLTSSVSGRTVCPTVNGSSGAADERDCGAARLMSRLSRNDLPLR